MKKLVTGASIILLLVNSHFLYSQDTKISLSAGYGTYSLETLKDFQEQNQLYDAKSVIAFPNNVYYSGALEYFLNEYNSVGLNLMYLYTGGRNSVSDYSGQYTLDILVHAYRIGSSYKVRVFENVGKSIEIQLGINIGFILSDFNATESIDLYQIDSDSQSFSYKQSNPFAEPVVEFSYLLGKGFYANYSVGYEFDVNHEIKWFNLFNSKESMRTDWSGLRMSLGISFVM